MSHLTKISSPLKFSFYYVLSLFLTHSKVQEEFRTLNNEIEGFKRASADEMLQNERLTIILKKNQSEEANLERLIALGKKKKESLEMQLSAVHKLLEQTDKEMQVVMLVSVHAVEHKLITYCYLAYFPLFCKQNRCTYSSPGLYSFAIS
jgi:hypothetical protein